MPNHSMFGQIITGSQVELAVIATLKEWFPDYLREMEYQLGYPVDSLDTPKNYINRNSLDAEAAEDTPKIVVVSPGLLGPPQKTGAKVYRATWRIGVGIAIAEDSEEKANDYVKAYAAAARKILLDHQSLGGLAVEISWVDENYPDLPIRGQITLYRAAGVFFTVDVENVSTKGKGPDDHGLIDYGEAQTVEATLTKVPIQDEV